MVLDSIAHDADEGWDKIAWLPLPALIVALLALSVWPTSSGVESPWLLLVANFVFGAVVSILVVYLAGISFLTRGRFAVLAIGCGVVFWGAAGLAGAAAAIQSGGGFDVNTTMTIFGCCAWLSAFCQLVGAAIPRTWAAPERERSLWQVAAYTLCIMLLGALVYAVTAKLMPPFYIEGEGTTATRSYVLFSAGAMLAATTALSWAGGKASRFHYWYGLALLYFAASLFALLFMRGMWEWYAWACRASQAIGGCYLLFGVVQALRGREDESLWLSEPSPEDRYRYGVAFSILVAAAVVHLVFLSQTPLRVSFNVFYPAVALAALYGGFGPGIFVAVLSVALSIYFSRAADGSTGLAASGNLFATFLFIATSVLVSWLAETVRRALDHARQTEKQLRLHRDSLENVVHERTADLTREVEKYQRAQLALLQAKSEADAARRDAEAARAEAEGANEAKSRFMAAISHDLRQPFGALSIYVGMLASSADKPDARFVRNMQRCIANLGDMLDNLLDISTLESGRVTAKIGDCKLDDILAEIVASYQPRAEAKGLSLRCRTTRFTARTDPVLFGRIVTNIVSNAIRYTERGGVVIGVRRLRGKCWLEIWDSGIGIAENKIGQVFEEFRQLGNSERNREKGSGLGLAIVARTATLLGLEVRVRSRPGKGTVFAIELRRGGRTAAKARKKAASAALRVALVEDDRTLREALVFALKEKGREVVVAASGEEIRARLGAVAPDLVVSDYALPGGESGVDVVCSLRQKYGLPLPALIITGNTDSKLLLDAMTHGIQIRYKPISAETLEACISDLAERASSEASPPRS